MEERKLPRDIIMCPLRMDEPIRKYECLSCEYFNAVDESCVYWHRKLERGEIKTLSEASEIPVAALVDAPIDHIKVIEQSREILRDRIRRSKRRRRKRV